MNYEPLFRSFGITCSNNGDNSRPIVELRTCANRYSDVRYERFLASLRDPWERVQKRHIWRELKRQIEEDFQCFPVGKTKQ